MSTDCKNEVSSYKLSCQASIVDIRYFKIIKLSVHLFITKKFNYSSLDKLYNTDQKCLICS
jgi:hypothetical protein